MMGNDTGDYSIAFIEQSKATSEKENDLKHDFKPFESHQSIVAAE